MGAAIAVTLLAMAVPVEAEGQPLFPEPTSTLSCANDGTSVFTIHWPVGEYGAWSVGDNYLGDLAGPGGVFTTPTDESFTVPAGWQASHGTVRLNRDTVGETSYNQVHLTVDGEPCPFRTPVSAAIDCTSRNLATSIPSGYVTLITVYDQDGNVIFFRRYPRYSRTGQLLEGVQVGPVVLNALIPATVTSVRVEVTVNNTVLSTSLDTSCVPVPPPGIEVSGVDGQIDQTIECDGTVSTALTAGTITIDRTGADDQAITVDLAYSGDLASTLESDLPDSVRLEAGQNQVVLPVESDTPGSVEVTLEVGTGYEVGARSSATVRVPLVSSAVVCDTVDPGDPPDEEDAPGDPTDVETPGAPAVPAAPAAPIAPITQNAPIVPAGPTVAPPADVISGVAHLTG